MTSIPKRALMAVALAATFAGLSATAIAQNTTAAPAAPATTQQAQEHSREGHRDAHHAERMARLQKHVAERQTVAAMEAERDARMTRRHDAIKSFYAALNTEQQKCLMRNRCRALSVQA